MAIILSPISGNDAEEVLAAPEEQHVDTVVDSGPAFPIPVMKFRYSSTLPFCCIDPDNKLFYIESALEVEEELPFLEYYVQTGELLKNSLT